MQDDNRLEDLLLEWEERLDAGQAVSPAELCAACPELQTAVEARIAALERLVWLNGARPTHDELLDFQLAAGSEPVPGYVLERRIGRGGFGEVWKAAGPGERPAALKFLPRGLHVAKSEERGLASMIDVRHPHLLSIFGTWQRADFYVIAMELADRTLFDRWHEATTAGAPGIPRDELLRYCAEAAEAIDYLNEERDIQHRDVKPHNLLLCGGSVKVGDFGLARLLVNTLTGHTGSFTLAYAPPEFFHGHTSRFSDQYSLAATYCFLRAGKLPFTGSAAALTHGHLNKPPDLTMLPPGERPAIARALAKEPRDRWPNCKAMVEAVAKEFAPMQLTRRQLLKAGAMTAAGVGAFGLIGLARGCFEQEAEPIARVGPETDSVVIEAPPPSLKLVRQFGDPSVGTIRQLAAARYVSYGPRRYLIMSAGQKGVHLWDANTGAILSQLTSQRAVGCDLANFEKLWGAAALDDPNEVLLWDLEKPEEVRRFKGKSASASSVVFSPDNKLIVSAATDDTISVWNRGSGELVQRFHGNSFQMRALMPNNGQVLSAGFDGSLRLWNLASGELVRAIPTTTEDWALDVDPSGTLAITGGKDRVIRLWNLITGELVRTFTGHTDRITSLSFFNEEFRQPRRHWFISGSYDRTARIWDYETGQELYRLQCGGPAESVIATRPYNYEYVITTDSTKVQLWAVPE